MNQVASVIAKYTSFGKSIHHGEPYGAHLFYCLSIFLAVCILAISHHLPKTPPLGHEVLKQPPQNNNLGHKVLNNERKNTNLPLAIR